MTKPTRLLAVSFISLLPALSFAGCTLEGTPNDDGSGANGGTNTSGSGGTTGGVGAMGGGAGVSVAGVGGTPMSAGGAGGVTGGAGGVTGGTGGVTAGTGGVTAGTGGMTAGTGGVTAGTGGMTAGSSGSAGVGGSAGSTGGMSGGGGSTSGSGGGGGTGSTACPPLPDLPDGNALTYMNEKLPSPFEFYDGTPVTTKAQWECRRKEILHIADKYIYGPVPPAPDMTTGTVSGGTVNITATFGSQTQTFTANIAGSGTAIGLKLSGALSPSGSSKTLTFGSGFEGKIRTLFGLSASPNTNIANGWMIDRVMDVLEQNPTSGHDPTKIWVSGCSGCGKGAFLAGIFSRAPLVIIVESGGGGAANYRQAEWFRHGGGNSTWMCADALPQSIDNLEDNGICGPWVTAAASWLRSNPSKVVNLPIDMHLMLATVAPRYLLHFSNNNGTNSWCHLGGTCEALSSWAAKPVYRALGIPERMGFQMYSAGHCSNPSSATSLANLFFQRAFEGSTTAATDVMTIMDNGVQQPVSEWEDMWVDWDMNTVLQ